MKKYILYLAGVLLFLPMGIEAQTSVRATKDISYSQLKVVKNENQLFISMDIDISQLKVKTNQEVILTPVFIQQDQSQPLPEIRVSGRNRYYSHLRNDKKTIDFRNLYRTHEQGVIHYLTTTPYEDWMEEATLLVEDSRCGCLNAVYNVQEQLLTRLDYKPKTFVPHFVYLQPVVEDKKIREVSGSAYINFPVNRTVILPDYKNNPRELRKILASIDSIKSDRDTRITALNIIGFASPEGPYAGNERLAQGRMEALIHYLQQISHLSSALLHSDYEAEDWDGLRNFVAESDLSNKEAILAIIDGPRDPDTKEWLLKSKYPAEYRILVADCYPSLRHTDYIVEYKIKAYTDVEEAKRVMQERPGNLSLNEFYRVANSYEEGSPEYNEVFNTMVKVYPNDPTANLNAANAAMSRGDMISAETFLEKAGTGPKVDYAKGLMAALQKEYASARTYLNRAQSAGITEAAEALQQLDIIQK